MFDALDTRTISRSFKQIRIGDIGPIQMCHRVLKHQTSSVGAVPFYKVKTLTGKADCFLSYKDYDLLRTNYAFPRKGSVLISLGGTIGRAKIYDGEPAYFQDSNIGWVDNDESLVLNKYLYFLYSVIEFPINKASGLPRLYYEDFKNITIPAPSLETQSALINKLETYMRAEEELETLLENELVLRKKQFSKGMRMLLGFGEV